MHLRTTLACPAARTSLSAHRSREGACALFLCTRCALLYDVTSAQFVTLHWLPFFILLQSDGCTFVSCVHSDPCVLFHS